MKVLHITELDAQTLLGRFNFLKNEILEIKNNLQPKKPIQYLTRQKVAEMLSITLTTVNEWRKKGILKAYKIGGRTYFKRHEVEEAIVELETR